tara:strand:- start:1119 stop:2159 length:1041 start_codon:yes stop_codon:yes gene_type:complete
MKHILTILFLFISVSLNAQAFNNFFRFSTIYSSVNGGTSVSDRTIYDVNTGELLDNLIQTPYDYSLTMGIRKIQMFQYEPKTNFKDGTETSFNDAATIGRVKKGFEYLFEVDFSRQRGEEFLNQNHFLRYMAPHWMARVEYLEDGFADIKYFQSSQRVRINSKGKLSFNVGACQRVSEPYGFNPLEQWMLPNGGLHYTYLAIEEGYNYDLYSNTYTDPNGVVVATSTEVWEAVVVPQILEEYVKSERSKLPVLWNHSLILGADYYYYQKKIWIHTWVNLLPYHYNNGGEYSYHNFNDGDQWFDYSGGGVFGYKYNRHFGIFVEGKYNKYWDREWYDFKFGINYKIF